MDKTSLFAQKEEWSPQYFGLCLYTSSHPFAMIGKKVGIIYGKKISLLNFLYRTFKKLTTDERDKSDKTAFDLSISSLLSVVSYAFSNGEVKCIVEN